MKSLLELITCYGSSLITCYGSSSTESESRQPAEESRLLVATKDRRRVGRKRGKVMGMRRGGGAGEWSPSLSSISENNKLGETNNQPWPTVVRFNRNLMRKVGSVANKDQDLSSHRDDTRDVVLLLKLAISYQVFDVMTEKEEFFSISANSSNNDFLISILLSKFKMFH